MAEGSVIYLVEDDEPLRIALTYALESRGVRVRSFATGVEVLAALDDELPDCLLLDLSLPDLNGLRVQQELHARHASVPIVFMSGAATNADSVKAMRAGAVDFLEKPFSLQSLIDSVDGALAKAACEAPIAVHGEGDQGVAEEVRQRYARLTSREREIMALVVSGCSSRDAADQLGISPRTVDHHRARIIEKMGAASLAELGHMAALCETHAAER